MRDSVMRSILIICVLGCGSGQSTSQPRSTAPPPAAGQTTTQPMCPMMPPAGTNVVATDTNDGVAIAFTTTGDVADLRTRVHRMAEMHEKMRAMHHGGEMDSGMGSGDMHGRMMHTQMMAARVTVEDIPGGSRLVFVPSDPSQVSALRDQAREHAAMMAKGECPMMKTGPEPKPDGEHSHHPSGA